MSLQPMELFPTHIFHADWEGDTEAILQHTKDLLPSILENSLIGVEEQKKMKWGKANIFFIRPFFYI